MRGQLSRRLLGLPALRVPDFCFLGLATGFNGVGMVGQMVVIGWLVLGLTNSPFLVGVTTGLFMVPMLLLGIPAGAIVDMVDRRRLLRSMSLAAAAPAALPGLLVVADRLEFWHILLFTFASGGLQAVQQTTRQSLAYDIVGPSLATSGLALVTLAMRIGGLVGAIAAGSLIERAGVQYAYAGLAGAHLCSFAALLAIRSRGQAAPAPGGSVLHNLKDYFSELRRNRTLFGLVLVTGGVEVLGFSHQVLLPSLARDLLHTGAEGLGIMNAARSVGGILGILVLASMGDIPRKGAVYLGVLYTFATLLMLLGRVESLVLVILLLTCLNAAAALSDVLSQAMMQQSVRNELRGRAMGSWILAIGAGPLGHSQIGALASLAGVTFALSLNGAGLLALAIAATLLVPSLRRL